MGMTAELIQNHRNRANQSLEQRLPSAEVQPGDLHRPNGERVDERRHLVRADAVDHAEPARVDVA